MRKFWIQLISIVILIVTINAHILNKNVERNVDLSSQLIKETIKITAEETTAGQALKEYQIFIPKNKRKDLSFFSVKDGTKRDLKIREEQQDEHACFTVLFSSAAPSQVIQVDAVYTNSITPFPVEIKQTDKQLVKYSGEFYFYSPYKTFTQTTLVKLSSTNIISYSQIKPFTVTGNKIKYGPYEGINELNNEPLIIHYENQTPFLTVTHLERTIEVSHWGNIAVKENIHLTHSGAKLKGSFSRYEFQKDGRSGQSAVKYYKTILPASAVDIYYRDSNGNISTSNMKVMRDAVELELRPRFPLFGGWKTQYTIGYNVPSFEYLFNSNENYLLKMRVIDHIFDDMVIDEAVVKIILPEGSKNIKLQAPYTINMNPNGLVHTYLDTIGRPVISFSKSNLVENHISDFELKYTFKSISLLQEPLLLIGFIFTIFILTIIYLRLDFSIATHQHKE